MPLTARSEADVTATIIAGGITRAGDDAARAQLDLGRPHGASFELPTRQLGHRLQSGQVLGAQAGLWGAPRAHRVHSKAADPRARRQRGRVAQDLATAF